MTSLTRRRFLRGSAAAGAAVALGACSSAPRPRSPNEEVRVAVAGLRGRGRDHVAGFARLPNVRVVALCDVDSAVLAQAAAQLEQQGTHAAAYADYRALLDRADVDAVSIATPNHWHALQAVWACQAGKDVYVEKPVSHNVWEGRQIVHAARRHRRIVQAGTQCRSSGAIRDAFAWVREGNLGRITLARGLCYKPRPGIGRVDGPQAPPGSVDYELWTGPAPMKPLRRRNLHYDWHWDFDTGNGDLGNQGIHQMDLCRWALGESALPPRVFSLGGRLGYEDDGNTPNTLLTYLEYERAPLLFEVRGLPRDKAAQSGDWGRGMDSYRGAQIGVIVHCQDGFLRVPDYSSAVACAADGAEIRRWEGADDHYANFIAAVRSRRPQDLTAEIEEGHLSSALCHLGNLSYQVARGGPAADSGWLAEARDRMLEHLQRNGVDPAAVQRGAWLDVDPGQERLAAPADAAAQALLTRAYRAPYVMPERV
ncbi:MAG: Gfo/Idh/MocA family oxidoreductase [Planctomycetota bacterium]|nr:MAG: Gfo/Idh/MocA family oxidoreductase [Planctomycetota bacterium]